MGGGPLSAEPASVSAPLSWKLAARSQAATQGIVASGLANLPLGRACFLKSGGRAVSPAARD
jgi:hypothetical protein